MLVTLLLISIYYYLSSCYINTSNDGSHYALVSAIVNKHTVIINDYVKYTGKVDYAVKNGQFYSDRLPGNALLMIPFFAFGNLLELMHLDILSNHIPIQEVTVILLPNICGVLGILFVFLFCKWFNCSYQKSLFFAVIYGLCTLNVQESTHVFSHAPSMCFVLMAFYFLVISPSVYHKYFYVFVFLLAYATIVELQNCLLFLPAAIYSIQTKKINFKLLKANIKVVVLSTLIFFTTLSILLLYNYIAFGEITLKSNKFNPEFPEEQSFLTSLSGNFWQGLDFLFTNFLNREFWFHLELGVQNNIPGLFVTSPILILSFLGMIVFFKKYTKEALMFLSIILINVFIGAFHKTVLTRHIFTITPFLFLPIIFLVNYFREFKSKISYYAFCLLFVFLAGFSCYRVFYVTHTYWGRDISNILPFTKEFKIYLAFLVFVMLLFYFGLRLRSNKLKKQ
ncbi:MAG: hypothetical protein SFY56_16450 [Bacteroidota bacterium]|nr:hypothetical protein [Bacteroidota bacterium]